MEMAPACPSLLPRPRAPACLVPQPRAPATCPSLPRAPSLVPQPAAHASEYQRHHLLADPARAACCVLRALPCAACGARQYTVFGKVVDGDDVLAKMENTETVKEGIFVMPKERIEISRTDFRGKKSQREL